MEILKSDRLVLRELEWKDVPELMKIFSNPISTKYILGSKTLAEVKTWVQDIIKDYQVHGHALWAVINNSDNSFVGICGLTQEHLRGGWETNLGYFSIPHFWGNGYTTEACKSCIDYAFNQLNKKKIVSFINPDNSPAIAVAKRVGMRREVILKASENSRGEELIVYSISK